MASASNPFSRAWRYLRALISGKLDQWEDPEIILNEAVREMKDNQIKNRELAVQAITQKNNLQAEVDKNERMVAEFERKATLALQSGNRELAKQFLKEKALYDQTLQSMRGNLAAASEASEKVKIQSEAQARGEVASTSIDSKLREMEVSQMDVEADRQLAELEAKLSLGGSPANNYTTNTVQQVQTVGGGGAVTNGNGATAPPESEIDRQLAELEARLGGHK